MGLPLLPLTHLDFQQHFLTWQLLTVQGLTHSDGARCGIDYKRNSGIWDKGTAGTSGSHWERKAWPSLPAGQAGKAWVPRASFQGPPCCLSTPPAHPTVSSPA